MQRLLKKNKISTENQNKANEENNYYDIDAKENENEPFVLDQENNKFDSSSQNYDTTTMYCFFLIFNDLFFDYKGQKVIIQRLLQITSLPMLLKNIDQV